MITHSTRCEGSFLFGYFLVWGHGNGIWLSFLCDCLNEKHAGIVMLSMLNFLGFKTEFVMLSMLNFLGFKTEFVMLSMLNFLGFKTEFVMLYLLNFLGLKTEIVMLYMLFFFFLVFRTENPI